MSVLAAAIQPPAVIDSGSTAWMLTSSALGTFAIASFVRTTMGLRVTE